MSPRATRDFASGVAVREQLAFAGDDERVALLADADAVDHPPHLLEVQTADEPPVAVRVSLRRTATMAVGSRSSSTEKRDISAPSMSTPSEPGTVTRGRAEAARDRGPAVFVEQRQLLELGELEDEVLEDAILLPGLEAGLLQVGARRP